MQHLNRLLDRAVNRALLAGVAGLSQVVGCGGQSVGPGGDLAAPSFSFEGVGELSPAATPSGTIPVAAVEPKPVDSSAEVCLPAGTSRLAQMDLSEAYDFVAWRTGDTYDEPSGVRYTSERDTFGTACASAADRMGCLAALDGTWPGPGSAWIECSQVGCIANALVTNHGDDVRLHDSLEAILSVLGAIDTPQEAVFWAEVNAYSPTCETDELFALPKLSVLQFASGYRLNTSEMVADCPIRYQDVVLDIARDGRVNEVSRVEHQSPFMGSVCVGRRPRGLVESAPTAAGASSGGNPALREVGSFFARMAALEDAAVFAFSAVAAELDAFGAPRELVHAARDAAADEVRHGRIGASLARRYGVEATSPEVSAQAPRGLFEFALENIVEGCVRETFGAAVARYQAGYARDPQVRAQLAHIALDECRHAELSHSIQEWLEPRLTSEQSAMLAAARRKAVEDLRLELEIEPEPAVQWLAGMPSSVQALALLEALDADLWHPSALGESTAARV